MKLEEMKVIVTGGAKGMGAYFVERLVEAGARVAAGDVSEEGLAKLPDAVHRRRLDVADSKDCRSFVAWAHDVMDGLDGLVNNAGIIRDGLLVRKDRNTGAIQTMSDEQWQAVLDVNLSGATYMVREFAALLAGRAPPGPAAIVNMSSVARHGNRGQSNYVATKAALAANTVTWAREFARFGIRVGAIAPGMIETPMTEGMNQKARDALVAMVPVGRIGRPEDIWLAVKFIFECDYFNGRCLDVDGGLVM
ncbi:MAG: SDR family oxidoreductase [Myxococcota bacterium]